MSDIEEPVNVTEQDGTDQIIDLDDVEGHGLREVAAGLGAAAVLAGAGTAAAAAVGVHPSLPGGIGNPSVSSVVNASDRLADGGVNTIRGERDAALNTTANQLGATSATANRVEAGALDTADAFVDASTRIAGQTVQGAGQTVANVRAGAVSSVDATTQATGTVVRNTSTTAGSTVSSTGTTATTTTDAAARKVATVTQMTIANASALVTSIQISVSDVTPAAGAGASAQDMSGFVTLDLGGSNLVRVELQDGHASFEVNTSDLGDTVTATYSGDSLHASSTNTIGTAHLAI